MGYVGCHIGAVCKGFRTGSGTSCAVRNAVGLFLFPAAGVNSKWESRITADILNRPPHRTDFSRRETPKRIVSPEIPSEGVTTNS
jgi:hypothetical protein